MEVLRAGGLRHRRAIFGPMPGPRPTLAKILATVGPASDSPETIAKLIEAGVACFRLNFSHGTLDDHLRRLTTIRAVADQMGVPVGVLGDLPGPKIRVGKVADPGVRLSAGDDFLIVPGAGVATQPTSGPVVLNCTYAGIASDVRPGHKVLINDGAVRALAVEPEPADAARSAGKGTLRCRVTTGGLVTSGKGINLPQTELAIPALTQRDWDCVEWAVRYGVDFLALSFVRTAAEVRELKDRLEGMCSVDGTGGGIAGGASIPVIAKIEKPQALTNLDEICAVSDGLMVARGDLGVEMDIAQVPVAQKRIIAAADAFGKTCIVATQMLESMISSPTPTRAEAGDVATAIFQGADAVMLSAETAAGQYPVVTVDTMRRIIESAEDWARTATPHVASPPARVLQTGYRTASLAHGAWYVARDARAKLIVCWSQRGGTARYLSQTSPGVPIIAYSSSARETRRMALFKGVTALRMDPPPDSSLAAWNRVVDDDLLTKGWCQPGDPVVLVAGRPLGVQASPAALAVAYVANRASGFHGF
jgi:pyruvate kinase